jgi:tctex1 domain-containing protein 2
MLYVICLYSYCRLKPSAIEEIMQRVLRQHLAESKYDQEAVTDWTKTIAQSIKDELKATNLPRYKHIVQVVIGENKGAGVRYVFLVMD